MLFAISGSQGSGKSSVLAGLEERGYNVLQRKISRSILADWDVSLEEVNTDLELSLRFQDEILKRKYEDEIACVNSDDIFFTERTYMDSFVYYLFTFGCVQSLSQNITDYYDKCFEYNQLYSSVFYLPSGRFATVSDGVRGTNPFYVESVDMLMSYYTDISIEHLHHVGSTQIEDRIDEVLENVNQFTEIVFDTAAKN